MTTAIATKKLNDVRDLINSCQKQIAAALPKHMTPERMARIAFSATQRQPKLLECTPQSLALSIINAAELGIEPNLIGEAYLVPYGNACTLIPGYKGLMKLARNSGLVTSFQVGVVKQGDTFEWERGSNKHLKHVEKENNDDAPITHFWAGAMVEGEFEFDVMTKAQVDAIRAKSKAGKFGPWVDHYEEMGKKTVIRRLCKLLPASAELSKAVSLDERAEAGLPQASDIVDLGNAEEITDTGAAAKAKAKLGIAEKKPAEGKETAIPAKSSDVWSEQFYNLPESKQKAYEQKYKDGLTEGLTEDDAHEAAYGIVTQ